MLHRTTYIYVLMMWIIIYEGHTTNLQGLHEALGLNV